MKPVYTMTPEQIEAWRTDLMAGRQEELAKWKRVHEIIEELRSLGYTVNGIVAHAYRNRRSCPFCEAHR